MARGSSLPYRRGGKNDGNDAEAICEAVSRPNMRFVPVKDLNQQSWLTLHRVRQGFIEERTATLNRIRGLLSEFGVVLPQAAIRYGARRHRRSTRYRCWPPERFGTCWIMCVMDERIKGYEHQLEQHARTDERAKRIGSLSGVGPLSASAIVASVAEAHEFDNGRQFAAWLGLVPRQYSTGGKTRLGRITCKGDPYLRMLLVMGARSVLQTASRRADHLAKWALAVRDRRGYHRACVAIAAKHARIIWALLTKRQALQLA
ncbi:MAG: IS110 family transposase [Steroidobacteraceae bacterium]